MDSFFRFPAPDFQSGYNIPFPATPPPESVFLFYLDVLLLVVALTLTGWFALKTRSRTGIAFVLAGSAAYFGFVRGGCVCSVGSIQNIVLALADPGYPLPLSVFLFFLLPVVVALFFGRLFCGGACPLGAVQDLVLLRPVRVPEKADSVLRLIPPLYLAVAVLAAATGSGFLICRFDPFVSLFRLSGPFYMTLAGFGFLGISLFVFRPYCRYLCPYGVLLGWVSRFSWKHLRLKQEECLGCGYCEDSCPEGAVLPPSTHTKGTSGLRRFAVILILLPVFTLLGGASGYLLHRPLSRIHPAVRLAQRIELENRGGLTETTLYSDTFRETAASPEGLYTEAGRIELAYRGGASIGGAILGALFGFTLISRSRIRRREAYIIDKKTCFSCGRCFNACPVDRKNRKTTISL